MSDVLKQVEDALDGLLSIGKRDLTNPKYDGYFEECRSSLVALRGLAWMPIAEMKERLFDIGDYVGCWANGAWYQQRIEFGQRQKDDWIEGGYTHFCRPILPTPPTREVAPCKS